MEVSRRNIMGSEKSPTRSAPKDQLELLSSRASLKARRKDIGKNHIFHPRLVVSHPKIAKLWHPSKNGSISPENVTSASTYRAWWICPNDSSHEYQRQVTHQVKRPRCPRCHVKSRSLAALCPDVAANWHPTLNGSLMPDAISFASNIKVWWKCDKSPDHAHQANPNHKTQKSPRGCPFCAGTKATESSSLAVHQPAIAAQLHPTLNGELRANQVRWDTTKKGWWQCRKDKKHKWKSSIRGRTILGKGCPYCSGYLVTDANRLSVLFPEIAAQWHPTKNRFLKPRVEGSFRLSINRRIPPEQKGRNRRLRPSDVAYNCSEKVWWQCKRSLEHVWTTDVHRRTVEGLGCPFCHGIYIASDNNLVARYPAVAKLWHPTRNAPLTPSQVAFFSGRKAWFRCPKVATHIWEAVISSVVLARLKNKSTGCPFCSGLRVGEGKSMKDKCPQAAKFWDTKRNAPLLPSQVMPLSSKRVWWLCPKSKSHSWQARVADFVPSVSKGHGCPFCSGRYVTVENCLKTKFPAAAKLWHPASNGELSPAQVTPGSSKVVWWLCMKGPGHEWQQRVVSVTIILKSGGTPCPYCGKRKPSALYNLWGTYPAIGALWDPKRNLPTRPWEVTPGTARRAWWRCPKGQNHVWEAKVCNMVTSFKRGTTGCPFCR